MTDRLRDRPGYSPDARTGRFFASNTTTVNCPVVGT